MNEQDVEADLVSRNHSQEPKADAIVGKGALRIG